MQINCWHFFIYESKHLCNIEPILHYSWGSAKFGSNLEVKYDDTGEFVLFGSWKNTAVCLHLLL